jgi:hypothetical protein
MKQQEAEAEKKQPTKNKILRELCKVGEEHK